MISKDVSAAASPSAWETGDQWHALTNLVLPASPYIWIDYQTPTVSRRYYRAAELP
jgi:hypothetical protein